MLSPGMIGNNDRPAPDARGRTPPLPSQQKHTRVIPRTDRCRRLRGYSSASVALAALGQDPRDRGPGEPGDPVNPMRRHPHLTRGPDHLITGGVRLRPGPQHALSGELLLALLDLPRGRSSVNLSPSASHCPSVIGSTSGALTSGGSVEAVMAANATTMIDRRGSERCRMDRSIQCATQGVPNFQRGGTRSSRLRLAAGLVNERPATSRFVDGRQRAELSQ